MDAPTLLMRRVADGDVEAFARAYDELAPDVFGIALRIVRDTGLAEDVTQEVFAWLWREAGRFDEARGSARGWVCTVARRRAVDCVRRETAWRHQTFDEVEAGRDSVVDEVLLSQHREHLRRVLTLLTERQQAAIALAYFGENTYAQVAELLNVNLSTLKSRIRDGLAHMRMQLEEEDAL